jgi:hypothetical protein
MVVIKLGGCNGSGKSSVARALLEKYKMAPCEHKNGKPYVYGGNGPQGHRVFVLGRYETACGGMDGISDKEERLELVRRYAYDEVTGDKGIVFYEGLITGKTYGAMGALSDEPGQKGRWLYAFMDTPFEVCVERVKQRRYEAAMAKGLGITEATAHQEALDAERTMRPTFKSIISTEQRARAAGHPTIWLPHDKTPAQIVAVLMKRVGKML